MVELKFKEGEDRVVEKGNIEMLFTCLDDCTAIIQNELNVTYLEALILTGEFLFQGNIDSSLSEVSMKKLKNSISSINLEDFTKEQIRKTYQLTILKGMKEGTQAHHAMTPDAVAMFMSYLVNKVTEKYQDFRLLDPAVGSGNLLTAILNNSNKKIDSFGIEPDETLLKLAYVNSNLQKHIIELFHQDSLTNIFIDLVDVVVSDLPIGYYPNQSIAEQYQLKADKGMSYTHHLIIEQMISSTKQGGFLIFLIPSNMFETDQAKRLHQFIKEHAHIYSLIQLPKSLFKEENNRKSIFILRRKGEGIQPPSQALLAELPSFSHKQSLSEMINSMNNWFKLHL